MALTFINPVNKSKIKVMKRTKLNKLISIGLMTVFAFILVSFINIELDKDVIEPVKITPVKHGYSYVMTPEEFKTEQNKIKTTAQIPRVEKDFVGFKEALAFKESQGKYHRVNTLGYLGKYQFGRSTLRELNIKKSSKKFLNDPMLQEKAFLANLEKNKWILRKEIKRFSGKWVKGIKITESGILAAAHLAGAGAVQKFLWSYGKESKKDAYGTKIEYYLKKFSGYDLSNITPKKEPQIIE